MADVQELRVIPPADGINERCPLQARCERRCSYQGRELDCPYYAENADGEYVIEDQEVRRGNVAVRKTAAGIVTPEKPERTLDMVAAEIRAFTAGMLNNAIEIGRRMVEAKDMLPYGKFGEWIQENTGYSPSAARNFMNLYLEYGDMQGSLFGASAESQTFGRLSPSQALALLAVPAEEREAFAVGVDAANLSVRELRRKIEERERELEAAKQNAASLEEQLNLSSQAEKDLQKQLRELRDTPPDELLIAEASQRAREEAVAEMRGKLDAAEEEARKAGETASALRRELNELKNSVPDGQVMEETLARAREEAVKEITAKLERAKAAKKKADEQCKEAEAALTKAKEDAAKAVQEAKESADSELAEVRRQLEKAREEIKQAALTSDKDTATFEVLFNQVQENANKMRGILLKIRSGENGAERAPKLANALNALADMIRRCAE